MKMFFNLANKNENIYAAKEASFRKVRIELEQEIVKFKEILYSHKMVYKHSTSYFWLSKCKDLPHLNKLTIILLNIQASSAFIERFFSITGVVFKSRCGNMGDDLIIIRSLLKTNMEILEKLSINEESSENEALETDSEIEQQN